MARPKFGVSSRPILGRVALDRVGRVSRNVPIDNSVPNSRVLIKNLRVELVARAPKNNKYL